MNALTVVALLFFVLGLLFIYRHSVVALAQEFGKGWARVGEIGGYVHDTAMSQFIPPNAIHVATGTWTEVAGQVVGTIVKHKAAAAETTVVTVPVLVPSNSVGMKGAYLKSIEVDYEILVAACTSVTATINKVTRGADLAVAVVASQAFTQTPTTAVSDDVDQHRLILTITTPFWVDNDEYVLVNLSMVAAATTQIDVLGAVANFDLRL